MRSKIFGSFLSVVILYFNFGCSHGLLGRQEPKTCTELCINDRNGAESCLRKCYAGIRRPKSALTDQMDLYFLVDMSNIIDRKHFAMTRGWIKQVVGILPVGPNNVRVGVAKFGRHFFEQFPLYAYKNAKQVQVATQALNRMDISVVRPRTDEALSHVTEMFSRDGRKGARQVCIVITAGNSAYPDETKKAADLARKAGIELFAVVVGYPTAAQMYEVMAIGNTERVDYTIASVTDMINDIGVQLRTSISTDPDAKSDVIFMLDRSVNAVDLALAKTFIVNVAEQLNMDTMRFGILVFDDEHPAPVERLRLGDGDSINKILDALDGIRTMHHNYVKDIARVMKQAIATFVRDGRKGATKVAILITNGLFHGPPHRRMPRRLKALKEFTSATKDPYRIFPYTVTNGRHYNRRFLTYLSKTSHRHVKCSDVTKVAHQLHALGCNKA